MDTLGRPVGVRVAGTVLVVAISASRVVGKGRGIAGLSLPLVGTTPPSVQETSLASKSSNQKLSSEKGEGRGGQQLGRPLVDTMKTLGAPVSVRVAGTVLVVAISASRVVSKGRSIAGLSPPLVDALGGPISVGVARSVLVVSVATSRVIGKGRGVAGLSLPLVVPEAVPVVDVTVLGLVG